MSHKLSVENDLSLQSTTRIRKLIVRFLWLATILWCVSVLRAIANDAGGGTNGVGANVTLTTNSTSVTLANGTIAAVITKSIAQVTSMKFLGREMVLSGGNMYFSMDGSTTYENPGGGVFWIKTNTTDAVDAGFRCTMTSHHAFNVDIHYVLRRGDTGLYVYAILSHPANYADTSYGEWRMVWKMDQDSLERIYADDLRNWQQPSAYDLANADPTGIAEIVKLTTGLWAGRYDCKYMYNVEYEKLGCYGHASNTNKIGAWMVFGGYDFFNDGPTKQDLAPASGINHVHFGRNHYNGSGLSIATNEIWSKCYGPFLLYCNTNALGGDACWSDAKAQVDAEKAAWPYAWLTGETNYPLANERGSVSGRLVLTDALKPAVNAGGAWVGVADPSATDWQFESKFYQYWVRADSSGNFVIPNVRPGAYTLHAFNVGAVDEFEQIGVTFNASQFLSAGTNTITLSEVSSAPATGKCTMYDYVALEMPGAAPAVQFLAWQGGAATNRWDAGTTSNWYAYGSTKVFVNGQRVLFNDAGSNAPVRLAGTLTPASVVVNNTEDYVFSGTGSLAGTMPLTKKGPGTLVLVSSNTYTGDTIVEGGTLRVSTVEPAAVVNGSFEKPLLAPGTYTTPADGPWHFGLTPGQTQGLSGIANGASVWSPTAADGGQYCYFWRSGLAAQDLYVPAGSYTVSCRLVGRKASTGTTYTPADVALLVVQSGVTNTAASWLSASQTYSWSQKAATFTVTNSGTVTLVFTASKPASNQCRTAVLHGKTFGSAFSKETRGVSENEFKNL